MRWKVKTIIWQIKEICKFCSPEQDPWDHRYVSRMLQGGMASVGTTRGRDDCQVLAWWQHCMLQHWRTIGSRRKLWVSSLHNLVTTSLQNWSKPQVKVKLALYLCITPSRCIVSMEIKLHAFLILVSDGCEWSVSCSGHSYPVEKRLGGPQIVPKHGSEEKSPLPTPARGQITVSSIDGFGFVTRSW